MRRILPPKLIVIALVATVSLGGCVSTKTILIPSGEPVQLAEPVETHVFVDIDGHRVRSDNRVKLPAGWWCLPDPDQDE